MGKDIATEVALVEAAAGGLTEEPGRDAVVDSDGAASAVSTGPAVAERGQRLARRDQRGMVSAEWAVGIIAAIAIAGVLLAVITSGPVQEALLDFLLWVIKQFADVVS